MRRLLAFLFVLFVALQGGVALARSYVECCDACPDALACTTLATCPACAAAPIGPSMQFRVPGLRPARVVFAEPPLRISERATDIWKPPW